MKRFMIFFITLMMGVSSYCQNHMKFQGIEINGTVKAFVDKMVQKGYKYESPIENGAMLSGTFTSKNALLTVAGNSSGNVIAVIVALPDNKEWKNLVTEYDYYKNLYTQKYGMPVSVTEQDKTLSDYNVSIQFRSFN